MTPAVPRLLACSAVLLLALSGCGGGSDEPDPPAPSSPSVATSSPPAPTASAAPAPDTKACHDLTYDEAVAPTEDSAPVPCTGPHTAITFAVGELDTLLDGHLLAVDSDLVQERVSTSCPAQLADFLGGTPEDRQLSMLRSVWFTPTIEESDAGAGWYRCDVTALAADEKLAPLTGRLAGVLDRPEDAARYAMCGTAEPGSPDFARVICSADHTWRAIATVPFRGDDFPGLPTVRDDGQQRCEDIARGRADDALNFKWGYEWPTAEQWSDGQHYGLCWAPD